jgi:hypothetical protein
MKKLQLNRQTLRELTPSDLKAAGGMMPTPTPIIKTLPLQYCVVLVSVNASCVVATCVP